MPGSIELHYGDNFSELSENFLNNHPDFLNRPERHLYLVRDRSRILSLQNRLRLTADGAAAPDFPLLMVTGFIRMLADKLNIAPVPQSFEQRLLLFRQIVRQNRERLQYFKYREMASFPAGVLHSLLRFFDEIRLADAGKKLKKSGRPGGGEKLAGDLALLFNDYRRLLETGITDEAGILREITEKIDDSFFSGYFPQLTELVWEDASFFKPLHFQLVDRLAKCGIHQIILLPFGGNPEIFAAKKRLFDQLKQVADKTVLVPAADRLADSLFTEAGGPLSLAPRISIARPVDRLREIEGLAGDIKRQVMDNRWHYSDIAVAAPAFNNYRPLLQTVFRRCRIPFTVLEPLSLRQSLPLRHLLLLLQLAVEDFPLNLLKQVLSSPFLLYAHSLRDPGYKKALADLRVRSGFGPITGQLRKQMDFYSRNPDGEATEFPADIHHRLLAVMEQIGQDLWFLESEHTAAEYYHYIANLISSQGITQKIPDREAEIPPAMAEDYLAAIRTFLEALHNWQLRMTRHFPGAKFSAGEFHRILLLLLDAENYLPRRPANYGVQILPPARLPQGDFRAVYLVGMEDGVFPRRADSSFTHPQSLRGDLRVFLPTDRLFRDRETFMRLLQLPAEIIRFSCPRFHQDNPVLPSLFLREIQRISDTDLTTRHDLRLHTAADFLEKISRAMLAAGRKKVEAADLNAELRRFLPGELLADFNFRFMVEKQRQDPNLFTLWEGALSKNDTVRHWLDHFYRQTRFSVSQLEEYANCPLIYFFQRILKTGPPEEAEETLSPLDKGIAMHNILYRFYREYSAAERSPGRLLQLGREELEKIPVPRGIIWNLEKELFLGNAQHKGLLAAFWEYEQETAARSALQPRLFEYSFGNVYETPGGIDPASTEAPYVITREGEPYAFKGKIDRVEIGGDGALLVVDYKTGGFPGRRQIWEGEKLQLPIYLKAVHHFLSAADQNPVMAGGAYYALKKESEIEKKIIFWDRELGGAAPLPRGEALLPNNKYLAGEVPADLEAFIERSFDFAVEYIKEIRAGNFPHTTKAQHCRGGYGRICPFLALCRLNPHKQSVIRKREEKR